MAVWAAAIPAIASVAGSLLKKGVDTSGLQNLINQRKSAIQGESDQINAYIGNLRPQLNKFQGTYEAQTGKSLADTIAQRQGLADTYKADMARTINPEVYNRAIGNVRESIYSNLPGTIQATKEQMAATGGLGRGSSGRMLMAPVIQAAQQFGQQASQIQQQRLQDEQKLKQDGINKLFSLDEAFVKDQLGMSREDAAQLLQNSRGDAATEINMLIGEIDRKSKAMGALYGDQANLSSGAAAEKAGRQNAIIDSISSGVGNIASSIFAKK